MTLLERESSLASLADYAQEARRGEGRRRIATRLARTTWRQPPRRITYTRRGRLPSPDLHLDIAELADMSSSNPASDHRVIGKNRPLRTELAAPLRVVSDLVIW